VWSLCSLTDEKGQRFWWRLGCAWPLCWGTSARHKRARALSVDTGLGGLQPPAVLCGKKVQTGGTALDGSSRGVREQKTENPS
jgi:hypothetical protein